MSLVDGPRDSYQNDCVSKSYPALPCSVPRARSAITEFAAAAGIAGERLESIRLAASEAVTNAVVHAYGDVPGSIHVTAAVASDELCVLISDDGRGMHPRTDSPGLGVGLALIAQLSDGMEIVSRGAGGTELRMRFSLQTGGESSEDQSRGSSVSATAPASCTFSITT